MRSLSITGLWRITSADTRLCTSTMRCLASWKLIYGAHMLGI